MSVISGVDEAGKGAVLGPLVIAAVGCESMEDLGGMGVRDSKELTPAQREKFFALITERFPFSVLSIESRDVDRYRARMTLNRCIARAHAIVIAKVGPGTAYVDACDVNADRYGHMVREFLPVECAIISEHSADKKYPIVSAASIVAKVTRDRAIAELEKDFSGIGSGYPSDPRTVSYLREYIRRYRKPPDFARKSWSTVAALLDELSQEKLTRFL
jgi:ribonuclease HII